MHRWAALAVFFAGAGLASAQVAEFSLSGGVSRSAIPVSNECRFRWQRLERHHNNGSPTIPLCAQYFTPMGREPGYYAS